MLVIKKAKSDIKGVTSAVRVEKNSASSPDVMINIFIKSREDIIKAKDRLLDIDGVKSIKYLITK